MLERRANPRYAVDAEARLILADGACVLDCAVLDISESGARVATCAEGGLPEKVYLWQTKSNAIFECEVRWREGKFAGLRIVDACGRQMRRTLMKACLPAQEASRISRWLEERGG